MGYVAASLRKVGMDNRLMVRQQHKKNETPTPMMLQYCSAFSLGALEMVRGRRLTKFMQYFVFVFILLLSNCDTMCLRK